MDGDMRRQQDPSSSAAAAANNSAQPTKQEELYGGAIVVTVPQSFTNVSELRQVPDNQVWPKGAVVVGKDALLRNCKHISTTPGGKSWLYLV